MRKALLVLIASCLVSCTTVKTVPLEPQAETQRLETSRVYFLRDSMWTLSQRSFEIRVNGQAVGNLANGSSFFVDRVPGIYRISAGLSSSSEMAVIDVQLEADKRYYLQVAPGYDVLNPSGAVAGVSGGAVGGAVYGSTLEPVRITPLDPMLGEPLLLKLK